MNKKNIIMLMMAIFLACSTYVEAKTIDANLKTHRIEKGTVLELKVYEGISTNFSSAGDAFDAMLVSDKKDGADIVLPKGTVFRGRVEKIMPKKMLSRSAVLYLSFDNVVTPTGKQIPIQAGLNSSVRLTYDGGISDCQNYVKAIKNNCQKAGDIIKKSTTWGMETGEGLWNGFPKYVLTPVAAIGGTIGGAGYLVGDSVADIFRKGNDVVIDKGTILKIVLVKPLDIPIN